MRGIHCFCLLMLSLAVMTALGGCFFASGDDMVLWDDQQRRVIDDAGGRTGLPGDEAAPAPAPEPVDRTTPGSAIPRRDAPVRGDSGGAAIVPAGDM